MRRPELKAALEMELLDPELRVVAMELGNKGGLEQALDIAGKARFPFGALSLLR